MAFNAISLDLAAQPMEDSSEALLSTTSIFPSRELERVLGKDDQGVFLLTRIFQNLWKAARGQPAKTPDNGPSHLQCRSVQWRGRRNSPECSLS